MGHRRFLHRRGRKTGRVGVSGGHRTRSGARGAPDRRQPLARRSRPRHGAAGGSLRAGEILLRRRAALGGISRRGRCSGASASHLRKVGRPGDSRRLFADRGEEVPGAIRHRESPPISAQRMRNLVPFASRRRHSGVSEIGRRPSARRGRDQDAGSRPNSQRGRRRALDASRGRRDPARVRSRNGRLAGNSEGRTASERAGGRVQGSASRVARRRRTGGMEADVGARSGRRSHSLAERPRRLAARGRRAAPDVAHVARLRDCAGRFAQAATEAREETRRQDPQGKRNYASETGDSVRRDTFTAKDRLRE